MTRKQLMPNRRTVLKRVGGAVVTGGVLTGVSSAGDGCDVSAGDYQSIQDAVDEADPGDTVCVGPGTYREQVIVRKDLTVRGEGNPTLLPPSGSLGVGDIAVVQPIFGAVGYGTDVTFEGFTVDGENATDKGGFYSCVGYFKADGTIRDVTATRADYGGFLTQNLGGGGEQNVDVDRCEFEELGFQPLVFNERGTTGSVSKSTFAGTPGTTQYALTAGFGASIDVQQNTFREFYDADGFSIGFFAFDSADCTVHKNSFEDVAYPAYFLADSSSGFSSSAGESRFVKNDIDGSGVSGVSYGTTIYANDPADDDTTETVNNIKVVNNRYANLGNGVATFAVGDGVVQNTKIIRNEFEDVGTPITDNGEETKQQANRI